METPVQRCVRIAAALEDLIAEEAVALANRDFTTVLALQERTVPLVDFLVTAGAVQVNAAGLRERLAVIHGQREQTSALLAEEMERTRAELHETQVNQRRAARMMPVYGQMASGSRRQLHAVG